MALSTVINCLKLTLLSSQAFSVAQDGNYAFSPELSLLVGAVSVSWLWIAWIALIAVAITTPHHCLDS